MDKVHGGTPKGFTSLCKTCRRAQSIRGLNLQEVVHCTQMDKLVTFPVESCTSYDDKRLPSLYDMEQIAWEVKSRSRGAVGFAGDRKMEIEIQPPNRYSYPPMGSPEGE